MKFARWVFLIAGIYGVIVLLPQYVMERRIGEDYPPAITHPEYFYGFAGVGLAWQAAFLVIAADPKRYRLFMLPAVLEKATFGIAAFVLFAQGRIPIPILGFASIDLLIGVLFLAAFRATGPK
jgi:hypothetical protein